MAQMTEDKNCRPWDKPYYFIAEAPCHCGGLLLFNCLPQFGANESRIQRLPGSLSFTRLASKFEGSE
jgi:hypothetical protein